MKKFLITFVIVVVSALGSCLMAQQVTETIVTDTIVSLDKYKVETKGFWDNWNISVGAGPQIYFGDHNNQISFDDRISPALDLAISKWFSPSIGLRLTYSGLYVKGATQNNFHTNGIPIVEKPWDGFWLKKQKFNFYNVHLDALLNLHNIIAGYKCNRFWSTSLYLGLGVARVWEDPKATEFTLNAGIINTFRINKHIDANLDVRGMMVNDRFSGDTGGEFQEGILSVTAGLTYWFSSGWDRARTIRESHFTNININELNERINAMAAENERLRQALSKNSKTKMHSIFKDITDSIFIEFPVNKAEISNETRNELSFFANLILQGSPDEIYVITGYADKSTGQPEINEQLSKERAEAVYNCLVDEFGVNLAQLVIDYKGEMENMYFNEPRLSRASIIRIQ